MLGRNSGLNSGADAGYQIMVIAFKDLSKRSGIPGSLAIKALLNVPMLAWSIKLKLGYCQTTKSPSELMQLMEEAGAGTSHGLKTNSCG